MLSVIARFVICAFLLAIVSLSDESANSTFVNISHHNELSHRAQWHVEHPGDLRAGRYSYEVPHRRYGASMVAVGGHSLVLMYGYNYDHARHRPVWLDDVWAFHPSPPLSRFNASSKNMSALPSSPTTSKGKAAAGAVVEKPMHRGPSFSDGSERRKFQQGLWRRKATSGPAPPPSYKHMAVSVHELILVFGGDDGGLSKASRSYQWGSFFSDLYILSVNSWRWRRVSQVGAPAARQGGSITVVGDLVVLFGGMVASDSGEGSSSYYTANLNAGHKKLNQQEEGTGHRKVLFEAMAASSGKVNSNKAKRKPSTSSSSITESNAVYVLPVGNLQGRPKRVAWHRCEAPTSIEMTAAHGVDAHHHPTSSSDQSGSSVRAPWPAPRRSHGAVAHDGALYIYGGFTSAIPTAEDSAASKNLSLVDSKRKLLEVLASTAPYANGNSKKQSGSKEDLASARNLNDIWRLTVVPSSSLLGDGYECRWEQLWPASADVRASPMRPASDNGKPERAHNETESPQQPEIAPLGRGGMAMAVTLSPLSGPQLVITNGAQCAGGCHCLADTWSFNVAARRWIQLATLPQQTPVGRYFMSSTTLRGRLFMFGGESYAPYAYWNEVWSLQLSSEAITPKLRNDAAEVVDYAELYSVPVRPGDKDQPLSALSSKAIILHTMHSGANYSNLMLRTRDSEEDKQTKSSFWGRRSSKSVVDEDPFVAATGQPIALAGDHPDEEAFPASFQRYYSKYYRGGKASGRLSFDDSDPLMEGSYFGGYESFEVPHPVLTLFFILPLSLGLTAIAGFCFVTRRKMKQWRKQNK